MARRTYLILAAVAAVAIIYQVFTLGYGRADEIAYHSQTQQATLPADERLTVIYEREIEGNADLLHLQVDTTYHARGKGGYQHEIVGKSSYSLRSFDGEYTDMSDAVAACFVMDGREWEPTHELRRQIAGYDCECVQIALDREPYRVWYTDALPHFDASARVVDGYRRLILAVGDAKGNYSLRAKYIGQQIG